LIRQEDTIVFALIERAQWARNVGVYTPGAVPLPPPPPGSPPPSLLEWLLRGTEAVHGAVRRYTSPDEAAFFPASLPDAVLPPLDYATSPLAACGDAVDLNREILDAYVSDIVPRIAAAGDDGNLGSAAVADVACLQALSKRVHYGKFVAEAKYRADAGAYRADAAARDAAAILARLTDAAVEDAVVARVRAKAAAFGADVGGSGDGPGRKVDPDAVAAVYREWVLPLTKEVQVRYLLARPGCD
jgi:chorismate mutase